MQLGCNARFGRKTLANGLERTRRAGEGSSVAPSQERQLVSKRCSAMQTSSPALRTSGAARLCAAALLPLRGNGIATPLQRLTLQRSAGGWSTLRGLAGLPLGPHTRPQAFFETAWSPSTLAGAAVSTQVMLLVAYRSHMSVAAHVVHTPTCTRRTWRRSCSQPACCLIWCSCSSYTPLARLPS